MCSKTAFLPAIGLTCNTSRLNIFWCDTILISWVSSLHYILRWEICSYLIFCNWVATADRNKRHFASISMTIFLLKFFWIDTISCNWNTKIRDTFCTQLTAVKHSQSQYLLQFPGWSALFIISNLKVKGYPRIITKGLEANSNLLDSHTRVPQGNT